MIYFEQEIRHLVVVGEGVRQRLHLPPPVKDGEYALREPSEPVDPWETGFGTLRVADASPEPSETTVTFEGTNLENLLDADVSLDPLTVTFGNNGGFERGLLAILRYFGCSGRALVQSQTSRAVERLWGGKLRRRTSYVVSDGSWASTGRLARDFFLAVWRELSVIHSDLANKRARVRALRIHAKPKNAPVTETGSAAAFAKRMNPLGAPPHLV